MKEEGGTETVRHEQKMRNWLRRGGMIGKATICFCLFWVIWVIFVFFLLVFCIPPLTSLLLLILLALSDTPNGEIYYMRTAKMLPLGSGVTAMPNLQVRMYCLMYCLMYYLCTVYVLSMYCLCTVYALSNVHGTARGA